jgi:nucleoid-associated protein YgaU
LKLREYRTIAKQIEEIPLSSPDRTHAHVIRRGDRLDKIAAHFYGDPDEWRRIAEANTLEDPRRLTPGVVLTIPSIPVE